MPAAALPAILILVWVAIICLKEWLHAWVAARLGVSGTEPLRRKALRPLLHEVPYATLGIPIALLAMLGLGMSGPALSIDRLQIANRRTETAIYLTGPLYHLALAFLFALPLSAAVDRDQALPLWRVLCGALSTLNIEALAFTLIPLPPFDAYRAVAPWLPRDAQYPISSAISAAMMLFAAYLATRSERGTTLIAMVVDHASAWVGLNLESAQATMSFLDLYRWVAALTMLCLFGLWYLVQQRR